ncbi:MAG: tetratricopeptide repeat protein [Candidatus Scalinduaceae bacterium]
MNTYKDELAPWERKKGYYKNIQLGKDTRTQMETIRDQTVEMIRSQVSTSKVIIASKDIIDDVINDVGYNMKNIGEGIYGIKAAFEWGISDVVWQIELQSEALRQSIEDLYVRLDQSTKEFISEAEVAYGSGRIDNTLENLLDLPKSAENIFPVYITLGIIYLFHKVNKEKALTFFDKAITHAKPRSTYYTSFALLYKALIKRDFGLIEEAEECSNEAMNISTNFAEAIYQNAQYSALLNKPDKAIPLLKKVISSDIVYCLKINKEQDFDEMRSQITKLFEEIRDKENQKVKVKHEELQEEGLSFNNIIDNILKLGYEIPETLRTESLREGNKELAKIIKNNSIFGAHIANLFIPQLEKRLQFKKSALKGKCQEIHKEFDSKIQRLGGKLLEEKKSGGFKSFLLYILLGQIIVLPIGLYIGMLGIYISEAFLFITCLYWKIILPGSKWKGIYSIQDKKEKLERILKRI